MMNDFGIAPELLYVARRPSNGASGRRPSATGHPERTPAVAKYNMSANSRGCRARRPAITPHSATPPSNYQTPSNGSPYSNTYPQIPGGDNLPTTYPLLPSTNLPIATNNYNTSCSQSQSASGVYTQTRASDYSQPSTIAIPADFLKPPSGYYYAQNASRGYTHHTHHTALASQNPCHDPVPMHRRTPQPQTQIQMQRAMDYGQPQLHVQQQQQPSINMDLNYAPQVSMNMNMNANFSNAQEPLNGFMDMDMGMNMNMNMNTTMNMGMNTNISQLPPQDYGYTDSLSDVYSELTSSIEAAALEDLTHVDPNSILMNTPLDTTYPEFEPEPELEEPQTRPSLKSLTLLEPGKIHRLGHTPLPTPQSITDGSYQAAVNHARKNQDLVMYIPRLHENILHPSNQVAFSVRGKPGPYLNALAKGGEELDGGYEEMFPGETWFRAKLHLDWPGVPTTSFYINCYDDDHQRITRNEFAHQVVFTLLDFFGRGRQGKLKYGPQTINASTKPYDLTKLKREKLRLIGLNYYRNGWVPVLAVDVEG